MIPLTQLLSPVSAADARALFVTSLVGAGIPADKWRVGGTFSTILTVLATTYAGFSSLISTALASMFLPYASGGWLVLLAYYVYGVTATPATAASGSLTFVNTGGGIYGPYAPGEFSVLNPSTKVTFTNVDSFSIGALATVTGVAFQAMTTGSATSAAPGAVNTLVTSALGVTVTNPASLVGLDAQSDPDVRTACLQKLASQSVRGPRDAYTWAVKNAINPVTNSVVNINRVSVPLSDGDGNLVIYAASPSGAPTADDLAAAAAAIELKARPSATANSLFAVTEVPYTASITIWVQATAGVSASDIQTAAENALTAFISIYPIGGLVNGDTGAQGLFWSGVTSVVGAAARTFAPVFSVDFNLTPDPTSTADLALVAGEVATDATTINVRMASAQ